MIFTQVGVECAANNMLRFFDTQAKVFKPEKCAKGLANANRNTTIIPKSLIDQNLKIVSSQASPPRRE